MTASTRNRKKLASLSTIMRYEWRILKADRVAQFVVLLFMVIVACGLINGFATNAKQQSKASGGKTEQTVLYEKTKQEIVQVERSLNEKGQSLEVLRSNALSPSSVYNKLAPFEATLPFRFGSILAAGQTLCRPQTFATKVGSRYVPFYPTVGTRSLGSFFPEGSPSNPLLLLLRHLDLGFITLYIYPLIILVLGFNLIAADRESGVLALLLAQGVPMRTIVLGKVFVRALLVMSIGVILPIVVASLIALLLRDYSASSIALTAALWILTATLYGSFWFALIVLINAASRNAAANGLIAVVCWIGLVFLTPALTNLAVQFLIPPASSFEFVTTERKASLELNSRIDAAGLALNQTIRAKYPITPGDEASQARYDAGYFYEPTNLPTNSELLSEFVRTRPEWKSAVSADQLNRALIEIKKSMMEQRLSSLLEYSNRQRERQKYLSNILRFASPTVLTHTAFDDIAGTGNSRNECFLAQLDAYIRGRENFFNTKILNHETFTAGDFNSLRPFDYNEEPWLQTLKRILVPLLALSILSIVLALFSQNYYRSLPTLR
jgi:ABC-2 type transport system permease protein